MKPQRYAVVDVFTDVPLQGNPLAVFTDATELGSEAMQRLARELNLSETVFVLPADTDAEADALIRIFTPTTELPFAGHPVLGTAFVLGADWGASALRLRAPAGVIPVSLTRSGGAIVFGEMEQPIPAVETFDRPDELLAALGVERSGLPIEAYRNGPLHAYVELVDGGALAALRPDLRRLAELGEFGVSCFAGHAGSFNSRMFAPSLGVPEDPATGSAAGPLAIHLARHRRVAYGQQIEIRQGAEIGRPSLLHARVEGSDERLERVAVGGAAVIVARGEFRLA